MHRESHESQAHARPACGPCNLGAHDDCCGGWCQCAPHHPHPVDALYLFTNGMVVGFDTSGNQVPGAGGIAVAVGRGALAKCHEGTTFHLADWGERHRATARLVDLEVWIAELEKLETRAAPRARRSAARPSRWRR